MSKGNGATRSSSSRAPKGISAPNGDNIKVETARYTDEMFTSAKALHSEMRSIYDDFKTSISYDEVETAAQNLKTAYGKFDDRIWESSKAFRDAVKTTGDRTGIKEFTSERERHEDYAAQVYNDIVSEIYARATSYGRVNDIKKIIRKV